MMFSTRRQVIALGVGLAAGTAVVAVLALTPSTPRETSEVTAGSTSASSEAAPAPTDPHTPPPTEQLGTTIEFARGTIRLEPPPADATPGVTAEGAFQSGFLPGPYEATTPPDRVLLAAFSNDNLGQYVGTPSSPREGTDASPEARVARQEDEDAAAGDGRTAGRPNVRPYSQRRLAWVFLYEDKPYDHGRAGVIDSDFAVVVDAHTGAYVEHFSQPSRRAVEEMRPK
jgi:hypothetical protein